MRWLTFLLLLSIASTASADKPKRILFLGDSNTQAAYYVAFIDAYLFAKKDTPYELINIGLASETVCGLTESDHPGPRPAVLDRLDKALEKLKPDTVLVCYGMNDGIYSPFKEAHFEKFKASIHTLIEKCEKAGAKVTLLTPMPFDAVAIAKKVVPATSEVFGYKTPYEKYDSEVLRKYSDWELTQKSEKLPVIDVHAAINAFVAEKRKAKPDFTVTGDGIHPSQEGHREAARVILKAYYPKEAEQIDAFLADLEKPAQKAWFQLVLTRSKMLGEAWREDIGHKRGGMPKALPVAEATTKAAELEETIRKQAKDLR